MAKLTFLWYDNFGKNQTRGMAWLQFQKYIKCSLKKSNLGLKVGLFFKI